MRRAALLFPILFLAAATPAQGPESPLDVARAEAAAAEKRQAAFEAAAANAKGEAEAFQARQRAALADIAKVEARIAAADLELAAAETARRASEARLAAARAPASALVAGVVTMGRRPPLMALADGGSVDEIVRLRALVDHGVPRIRARSAALAREAEAARQRTEAVAAARRQLGEQTAALDAARTRFAALERQAAVRAERLTSNAFLASDRVIAAGEDVGALARADARASEARKAAAVLARLEPLPPRPGKGDGAAPRPPFAYRLPSTAHVATGMGAVSEIGVSARGLTLATRRGEPLIVPADGNVLFAGPYRRTDGVVIIDHGGGWTSLIGQVRADVKRGERVRVGQPLGNALGEVSVELRQGQKLISPALIARSSVSLSNVATTR